MPHIHHGRKASLTSGQSSSGVHMKSGGAVALVAGARVYPDGTPSQALYRRVEAVHDLWREGKVSTVILSGGAVGSSVPESAIMSALLVEKGLPVHQIVQEDKSRNSRENIQFSLPLLAGMMPSRVILVSDVWHIPRLWMLLCLLGYGQRWGIGFRSSKSDATRLSWWRSAIREIPAFLADSLYAFRLGPLTRSQWPQLEPSALEEDRSNQETRGTDG